MICDNIEVVLNPNYKIRPFRPSDRNSVADLITSAFINDGFQFLKSPSIIEWRFLKRDSPEYETHFFVCENTSNSEIIGTVGCDFYEMWLKKRKFLVAELLGLTIKKTYQGQGLGRYFSEYLYAFVRENKRDLMISSTDPSGIVYKSIEKRNGFHYLTTSQIQIGVGNIFKLLRYVSPFTLILSPIMFFLTKLRKISFYFSFPRCKREAKIECITSNQGIFLTGHQSQFLTGHQNQFFNVNRNAFNQINTFYANFNQINSRYLNFVPNYTVTAWSWAKIALPKNKLVEKPRFFQLKIRNRVVAGLSVSFQHVYIKFLRRIVKCAIFNDFFIDYSAFSTANLLENQISWLIHNILSYCERKGALLLLNIASKGHPFYTTFFKRQGFLVFDWSQISVNPINFSIKSAFKQIFVGNSVAMTSLP